MQKLEHEQAAAPFGELELREIEFIRVYLVNGMNGTKAAVEVFGLNREYAATKAHNLLQDPRIASIISAEMHARMRRLRIDVDWVLEQAVEVFNRCMQTEKILDRHGNLTGEFKFDATNSLKALELIGKHVNVKAFEKVLEDRSNDEVLQRLQRARVRLTSLQRDSIEAVGSIVDLQSGDSNEIQAPLSFL